MTNSMIESKCEKDGDRERVREKVKNLLNRR